MNVMKEIHKLSVSKCDTPLPESSTVDPFNWHTLFMYTPASRNLKSWKSLVVLFFQYNTITISSKPSDI